MASTTTKKPARFDNLARSHAHQIHDFTRRVKSGPHGPHHRSHHGLPPEIIDLLSPRIDSAAGFSRYLDLRLTATGEPLRCKMHKSHEARPEHQAHRPRKKYEADRVRTSSDMKEILNQSLAYPVFRPVKRPQGASATPEREDALSTSRTHRSNSTGGFSYAAGAMSARCDQRSPITRFGAPCPHFFMNDAPVSPRKEVKADRTAVTYGAKKSLGNTHFSSEQVQNGMRMNTIEIRPISAHRQEQLRPGMFSDAKRYF